MPFLTEGEEKMIILGALPAEGELEVEEIISGALPVVGE